MLKSYFKLAFRNLKNTKVFSLINIAGLAIGISAALVIYLIVQHEFNFDKFHKEGNRVFRVVSQIDFPDMVMRNSGVPYPTARAVKEEATGIDKLTQFIVADEMKVAIPTGSTQAPTVFRHESNIIYADENYFKIFDYVWLAGNANAALKQPNEVVLTESRAKSYFGNAAPSTLIGKQVMYNDSIITTVAGVVKDFKQPSDFRFQDFISKATGDNSGLRDQWGWDSWGSINSNCQLFLKLSKGTEPATVEKQLVALREKYRERNKEDPESDKKDLTKHLLQPLADLHFNADYDVFNGTQGNKSTLYGLLAVGLFLLSLGCINFINLTTAQASQRAREIGIRKTMGSRRSQLMMQFLSETLLLTILATIVSVAIAPWLLKIFSDFIPEGISFGSLNQPHVWLFLIGLVLIVTFLSGFYPAMVLTRFKPVTVLKNQAFNGTSQSRKAWLRKSLTITQFVIAQFLLIAMLVVSKQVHYSINKDLGFNKEAIVTFNTRWDFYSDKVDNRRFALMDKIKSIPGIQKMSLAGSAPASGNTSTSTMKYTEGKKVVETMVEVKYADTNYFKLYGMKLLAGNNLEQSDTTRQFVINETYSKMLGFNKPDDAIGHFIDQTPKVPITGVIADFHTKSTRVAIKPLAFSSAMKRSYVVHLLLKPRGSDPDAWKNTLAKVGAAFKEIYPEDDFNSRFYDESIASFYQKEKNVSSLLKWAAGLCIFISCLGLLGLVIYITNSRTKEIGVRKVLGASITQLVALLSKDFILLVFIAFLITLPFAWWFMHNWLQDFVYRTTLSWWVFAVTGLGMIIVAMLILGLRTVRSAMANPVKSLRTE